MPLPKLTPLQSRFAGSLGASLILLLIYLSLNRPNFAYAFDLDSRIPPDHNHPILDPFENEGFVPRHVLRHTKGHTVRQTEGVLSLANNEKQNLNIELGQSQFWIFTKDTIDGPPGIDGPSLPGSRLGKRQDEKQVYITINTCVQPVTNISDPTVEEQIPPQLSLFISQSSSNQEPASDSGSQDQTEIVLNGGYALVQLGTDSDVYIGVSAPNSSTFNGIWNYEIAGSIDAPFHGANETWSNLYFVDGDNHAALLITNDTTQAEPNQTVYKEWMANPPPYGMIAHPHSQPAILGVANSYCGLSNLAKMKTNLDGVENQNVAQMTNRGLGGQPKEQFYITALNASSDYYGWLALERNDTAGVIGGGGTVWAPLNFSTKSMSNCALMYNLSFCSEVAYAVPTNPDLFSPTTGLPELAALYDSHAAQMYQYFNYSLQQIPCNTTAAAQYSLARNCDDCARAYKQWLCAVTIPRCEDYNSTAYYLKPRNVAQPFVNGSTLQSLPGMNTQDQQTLLDSVATNSSRNSIIDQNIKPGPYKEVLPCEDLCYDLVQSCPAALGFSCPQKNMGLYDSYWSRSNDSGIITCSYLGAAYFLSGAERLLGGSVVWMVGWVAFVAWVLVV